MSNTVSEADVLTRTLYRRVLSGHATLSQLTFAAEVLEKYRGVSHFQITRTNTIGTLRRTGGWKLDFGIIEGDRLIHTSVGDLANLPEGEREHWLEHLVLPALSLNFLRTRLYPASCIDDGEPRRW